MAYRDFTLEKAKKELGLTLSTREDIFSQVSGVNASDFLKETLNYNVAIALASNTEKSRSEMIIAPILLELTRHFPNEISLFSGVDFTVEPELGLNGNCDFILSDSPELLIITAPVVVVVEAKKENIKSGLGQCAAEMVAAKLFNEEQQNQIPAIYGAVTTGEIWKFLRLEKQILSIDIKEYFLNDLDKILSVFVSGIQKSKIM